MTISSSIQNFLQDESGPTAVEYAVMLALVLAAVISAITAVGNSTSEMMQNNSDQISTAVNASS